MKSSQNLLSICGDVQVIGYEYKKLVALGFPTHFPLSPNFKQFYKLSGQNYGQSDSNLLSSIYGSPIIFLNPENFVPCDEVILAPHCGKIINHTMVFKNST